MPAVEPEEASGQAREPGDLRLPQAAALARGLAEGRLPFARLLGCRAVEKEGVIAFEAVTLEVDVELAQDTTADIRPREVLDVLFHGAEHRPPSVFSLREDFPRDVPHLNVTGADRPASLCLYEEAYSDVLLSWTPARFVERLRSWLARTAAGTLHAEDQGLEPFFIGARPILVLPADLVERVAEGEQTRLSLRARQVDVAAGAPHFYVGSARDLGGPQGKVTFRTIALSGTTLPHGCIRIVPSTLGELHRTLEPAGIDLVGEIRRTLREWTGDLDGGENGLFVVIRLPLSRAPGGEVERTDLWSFLVEGSVDELGEELGVWVIHGGARGQLLGSGDARRGEHLGVASLRTVVDLSPAGAAALSGAEAVQEPFVLVGAGALGSQTLMNLVRTGFGTWQVFDNDLLLPHNLARHALPGIFLGFPKADAVSQLADAILESPGLVRGHTADVLKDGEAVLAAISAAALVLDISASVPVARHLALDVESPARRVSLFLNETGKDLVLLAEDAARTVRLDALEMAYLRAVAEEEPLAGHLDGPRGRQRYAQGCGDITLTIPQDGVAALAGVGARGVRRAWSDTGASIRIWRTDDELQVRMLQVVPSAYVEHWSGDWMVCVDTSLTEILRLRREERLPNETGGVLLGAHDMQRKRIYVVSTMRCPPDSEEWPTHYIRGAEGLQKQVDAYVRATAGALGYIGEWHSHPRGHGTGPSGDDRTLLGWIAKHMGSVGAPGLMLIVGDGEEMRVCLQDGEGAPLEEAAA